jgi:putative ABC transport system substrate-binding protein
MITRCRLSAVIGASLLLLTAVTTQASDRLFRVDVLEWNSAPSQRSEIVRRTLRELGYEEGRNLRFVVHHANELADRARQIAAEIVAAKPDVIVAITTPAALHVKAVTTTIPIVSASADPVGSGVVSNLSRPEANVTGVSNMMPEIEPKRVELLRELIPRLSKIGFLGSAPDPATRLFVAGVRAAASKAGVDLATELIDSPSQIDAAFGRFAAQGVGAVIIQPLFAQSEAAARGVAAIAARHKLPAISSYPDYPRTGGLIAYGPSPDFSMRTVAQYVDRILKGAKAGDLPVQQPTILELRINVTTATALGLTIPPAILLRADEVIE